MATTVRIPERRDHTRQGDRVANLLATMYGGRPETWRLRIYETQRYGLAILDGFHTVNALDRRAAWFQPLLAAHNVGLIRDEWDALMWDHFAADQLDDHARLDFLAGRTPDADRRWAHSLTQSLDLTQRVLRHLQSRRSV